MIPPRNPDQDQDYFSTQALEPSAREKDKTEAILEDLRAGLRTKEFLSKYRLTLPQFEELIRQLVKDGRLTKEEFKAWKTRKPAKPEQRGPEPGDGASSDVFTERVRGHVTTYIINDPEKNQSWALQLFTIKRENVRGAKFKVNLQGKKYAFIVEDLMFRGMVNMRAEAAPRKGPKKDKREEAVKFIAEHGWAKYLESRAYEANFGYSAMEADQKARLVLLHCRHDTYLAALHTPAPAINLYVGSSLESILSRIDKSIDTRQLNLH